MSFDGFPYAAGAWSYPYHYHPKAPATAKVLSAALRNAYFAARHHGKPLLCQSFGVNNWDEARHPGQAHWGVTATALARIAEGRAWIGAEFTTVTVAVSFGTVASGARTAYFKASVIDTAGPTTATSNTQSVVLHTNQNLSPGVWVSAYVGSPIPNYGGRLGFTSETMILEVPLAALTLSARCEIVVEGYCTDGAGSPTAEVLRPFSVTAWAHVED